MTKATSSSSIFPFPTVPTTPAFPPMFQPSTSTTMPQPTTTSTMMMMTCTETPKKKTTTTTTTTTIIPELSSPALIEITQSSVLHDSYAVLIRSFLDRELTRSALFHAERFFALTNSNVACEGAPPPPSAASTTTPNPATHRTHVPHATTNAAHTSRHLYALSLLLLGQTYSALSLVNGPNGLIDQHRVCKSCLEVKARCCVKLGRWRQAREALESVGLVEGDNDKGEYGGDLAYTTTSSLSSIPAMQCKAGIAALHGNMAHKAAQSFKEALSAEPLMWEAWEGLCAVGDPPDIDEVFPLRPVPTKRGPSVPSHSYPPPQATNIPTFANAHAEDSTSTTSTHTSNSNSNYTSNSLTSNSNGTSTTTTKPTTTGVGFFTPDHTSSPSSVLVAGPEMNRNGMGVGNLFHPLRHEIRSLRMGPRDSIGTTESSFFSEASFVQQRSRSSTSVLQTPGTTATSRPLSSADESGPVAKRLRSQMDAVGVSLKMRAGRGESVSGTNNQTLVKKRQALAYANIVPSTSGGRGSGSPSSRSGGGSSGGNNSGGKSGQAQPHVVTRRSSRLLSGTGLGLMGGKMKKRQTVSVPKTEEVEEEETEEWTAGQEEQAQQAFEESMAQYYIYNLTRTFALAVLHLSTFSCRQCLWTLSVLPAWDQTTSQSLSLIARAHYEVQDYRSAERAFKALRWKERYRVWDMEVYSSLLWQMGRGVELAFLAREMVDLAPGSGEAWIVVGNLFSVRKERERALGCFRRATELAGKGSVKAYGYTLCGHESVDEDLGSAIRYFEGALRVDGGRHYNAWYGLGTCYLRMGKVRMAEYHFRRAVGVNGGSAVLLGCVGLAVERRAGGEGVEALGWFERAVEVSEGRNALVRFRRAKIYVRLRRFGEAIGDLEYLKNATPEESNVIFELAKVYRLVGDVVKSAQMLAAARDVSPKSVGKIRRLVGMD